MDAKVARILGGGKGKGWAGQAAEHELAEFLLKDAQGAKAPNQSADRDYVMKAPSLAQGLSVTASPRPVERGPVLEVLGVMAAMLGGVLLFGLAATLTGIALIVAGGLAWVSGWWCNYESWCDRCRSIVEKK